VNAVNAMFAPMGDALFDQFAAPVTIQRGAAALVGGRCIVDDGTAQVGEYGQVIGRVTRVSFIKAEWDPARGDIVTTEDGTARKIESIEEDDGLVVKAVLHG
jgi:hypothetical protein